MMNWSPGDLPWCEYFSDRIRVVPGCITMIEFRGLARLYARFRAMALLALMTAPAFAAESPMLAELVASGKLPPLEQRLPTPPRTMTSTRSYFSPGKYGGELVLLMGKSKDVRLMVVYGYARLVGYNLDYELVPDVLESFEVEEDRRFTFHLRKGHRWSDGHPFTAESFRYYWEDIANNEDLAKFGPPAALLVDGEPPVFGGSFFVSRTEATSQRVCAD